MPLSLSASELSQLQTEYEATFSDTGQIGTRTTDTNAMNETEKTWSYGDALACGFQYLGGTERSRGAEGTITPVNARVRLPRGTSISPLSRFKLTHRYGTVLSTPQEFDVVGYPQEGPSGVVVDLQEVR